MVFRLHDFNDFLECASGCEQVFFKQEVTSKGTRIVAYAGRVYWEDVFTPLAAIEEILLSLKDRKAKEVLSDVDLEQIFR